MAQEDGVCVFVPLGQDGLEGAVFGMGILVSRRDIFTCTHVIEAAIGLKFDNWPEVVSVRICFPFAQGQPCIEATVFKEQAVPVNKTANATISDIAVASLSQDAPIAVNVATLVDRRNSNSVSVYGFRSVEQNGVTQVGRSGGWSAGTILGPLPAGRGQVDGIRASGIRVQPGFSGGGLYCDNAGGVVGMVVESSRNAEELISHYIVSDQLQKHRPLEAIEAVWFGEIIGGEPFVNREKFRKLVLALVQTQQSKILRVKGSRGSGKSHSVEYLKFLASKELLNGFNLRHFTIDSDYVSGCDLDYVVTVICEHLGITRPDKVSSSEHPEFRAKQYATRVSIKCESLPSKTLLAIDGLDANDLDDDVLAFVREFIASIHQLPSVRDFRLVLLGSPDNCRLSNHLDTIRYKDHCTEDDLKSFYSRLLHQHSIAEPPMTESEFVDRVFVSTDNKGRLAHINRQIKSIVPQLFTGQLGWQM